jgi:hypothetical protein
VKELEERLGPAEDSAVRVLGFGQALLVYGPEIRCLEPALLRLDGVDDQDRPVQVLQHVSQLNLAVVAVSRRAEKPVRIRFRS